MTELNVCVLGDGFAKGIGDPKYLGWAGRLLLESDRDHGPINYFNLGVPNQTSVEVVLRSGELEPRMTKEADNRLILSFGMVDTELVDGKPRVSNQESLEALKKLILLTRGRFKMIMIGLPPVYEPQRNNRIKRLNGLYRELCLKARVPYIDLMSSLTEDVQYKRELVKGDRIYPSEHGYEKVFDLIWNDRSWWFN